jgi:hypothetical protein
VRQGHRRLTGISRNHRDSGVLESQNSQRRLESIVGTRNKWPEMSGGGNYLVAAKRRFGLTGRLKDAVYFQHRALQN